VINKGDNLFVEGSLLKRIWEKEGFLKEETVVLAKKIITIKGGKNVEPEKSR
jgi:single-stranded DNA-binding protein